MSKVMSNTKSKWVWGVALLAALGGAACYQASADDAPAATAAAQANPGKPTPTTAPVTDERAKKSAVADFAGGCFWGSEGTFRKVPGVVATEVGYEGGTTPNPTYEDVCTERTGYAETVRVFYDPAKVTYQQLVDTFFENHDPTTTDQQGPDIGSSYRSVIFYHTPEQKQVAEADKAKRQASGQYVGPIVTQILPSAGFYRAEEYHQDYFAKQGEAYTCHLGNGKKS